MGGARRAVAVAAYYLSNGDIKSYWDIIHEFRKVRKVVLTDGGIHDFMKHQMFTNN